VAKVQISKAGSPSPDDAQKVKFERPDWTSFRTIEGLQQKAGVALARLIRLVLKELTDNALDNGANVEVGQIEGGGYYVEDDGEGLDPNEVADLFSVSRPLSSTKMFRLPTRGALGNGLRVATGAVLASGGTLAVETRGVRLTLKPRWDDGTTSAKRSASKLKIGTRIEITFGPSLPPDANALLWAEQAVAMAVLGGPSYNGASSPYWYDAPNFRALLSAAGDTPVRQLVASLDGCAGGRAGEIVAAAGLNRKACRQIDAAGAARLLREARAIAKPVTPKRLGAVGADCFPGAAYAIIHGETLSDSTPQAVIPFVVETWARISEGDKNAVSVSVNRTPVAARFALQRNKANLNLFGCGLANTVAKTQSNVTLWLNVTTPYMPITSDGKEPNLEPFADAIVNAIAKAIRKARGASVSGASQKSVVFDHMLEVIDIVSGGSARYRFNDRQLLYRMRPIVREELGQELKLSNWKSILDAYEEEHGEIELMYREPRGSITHPHRGETITLGTLMVEDYVRPVWTFNKLVYIEKEGAQEALKQNRWLERHDCAVMSSKGFSTRAARDLIDKLAEHDEPVEVFCAHDADASGSMIYQTLQDATRVRGARKIKIINIGLEPWEALAMGLEVETVEAGERRKPTADYIKDHDGEGDVDAKGDDISGTDWDEWLQTHRVELNAMTTPQLIDWLDGKMAKHGDGKLIPPDDVLVDELTVETEKRLRAEITERILREADIESRVAAAMATLDLPDGETLKGDIAEMFEDQPDAEWRAHIAKVVDDLT
jgi:hypothetical protein